MKKIILVIVFLTFCTSIYSQDLIKKNYTKTVKRTRIEPEVIYDNLYHNETGEKMTKEDFDSIIRKNGKISMKPYIDKYGLIQKYIYNPNPNKTISKNSANLKPQIGEKFPDFALTSFNGEQIELDSLKGKLVIIHFGLIKNGILMNKSDIIEIDSKINLSKNISEIESLIFFKGKENDILRVFEEDTSNFKLISNFNGFLRKWDINRVPTTIILDIEGQLIGEFKPHEIKLEELLK